MLLRIVTGSFRRHLCSSSCIFSTLAGLSAHRQPLRDVLPFLFSTFSKHLFRDRLCRTEFFHPSGAVWTQEEKDKWRTFMLKEFKQIFLSEPLGCRDTSNDFKLDKFSWWLMNVIMIHCFREHPIQNSKQNIFSHSFHSFFPTSWVWLWKKLDLTCLIVFRWRCYILVKISWEQL